MNETVLDRAIEILEEIVVNHDTEQYDPEKVHCCMGKQMQCPCDNPTCPASE